MRQPFARKIVNILSGIILLFFVGFLALQAEEILGILQRIESFDLCLIVSSVLLQWLIRAVRDAMIYGNVGFEISFWQLLPINNLQLLLNHLPMRAGTIYSAVLLKRRFNLEYATFTGNFIAQNLLTVAVTCFAGAACLVIQMKFSALVWSVIALFFIAGGAAVGMLFIPVGFLKFLPQSFFDFCITVHQGFASLIRSYRTFAVIFFLSLLVYVLTAWRMQLLFQAEGTQLNFLDALVLSSSIMLSVMVAITPAALGLREALVGISSKLLGISISLGVLVSSVERIIILCCAVVFYVGKFFCSLKSGPFKW